MIVDRLLRFLEACSSSAVDLPPSYHPQFLDKPSECVLFSRACNIEDMESEDDEQYIFYTPDEKRSARFNRFQTRIIFKRLGKVFDEDTINRIIKMSWNFNKLVINTKTGYFTIFNKSEAGLPPLPELSGPSIRTIYTS
jgi:hypothetical protein